MANIKVTLELDSQGYITGIKTADAATAKLGTTAATAGAAGAAGIRTLSGAMTGLAAAGAAATAALAPLLSVAAAVGTVFKGLTLADSIVDLAQASEISTAKIIALRNALAVNGGEADNADKMIVKLTNNLFDATEMGSKAQKQFLDLGFTLNDIQNLTPEEALQKTLDALSKIEDPVKRNAIAFDLFGKSAGALNLEGIANATRNVTEEQQRQAQAAESVAALYDDLVAGFNSFMMVVIEVIEPLGTMFSGLMDILDASGAAGGGLEILKAIVKAVALAILATVSAVTMLGTGLVGLGKIIYYAMTGQFEKAKDAGVDVFDTLKREYQAYMATGRKILEGPAPSAGGAGGRTGPAGRTLRPGAGDAAREQAREQREAEAYSRQISQAVELGAAIQAQTTSLEAKYATELKNIGLTQDQIRLNNELAALAEKQLADTAKINGLDKLTAQDKAKYIAEINARYAEQEQQIRNGNQAIAESLLLEQRRRRLLEEISEAQARLVKRQHDALIVNEELQRAVGNQTQRETQRNIELLRIEGNYQSQKKQLEEDFNNAIEQSQKDDIERRLRTLKDGYNEEIAALKNKNLVEDTMRQSMRAGMMNVLEGLADSVTPFQVAVDATSAVFGNLENAISEFARTGKLNFGEFAKSVIADLIAITLRTIILRTILSAFGGIFGGGAAAAAPAMGVPMPAIGGPVRFAAAGGSIRANQQYIVGEKGPELFLPNTSGTMIPNNKLGALGGGNMVTYNINAVDASSFRDLVARDPEFIYSVTQVGARRMPR